MTSAGDADDLAGVVGLVVIVAVVETEAGEGSVIGELGDAWGWRFVRGRLRCWFRLGERRLGDEVFVEDPGGLAWFPVFGECVGEIPLRRAAGRWVEDGDDGTELLQADGEFGHALPAGVVVIGPEDDGATGEWRPVGVCDAGGATTPGDGDV